MTNDECIYALEDKQESWEEIVEKKIEKRKKRLTLRLLKIERHKNLKKQNKR